MVTSPAGTSRIKVIIAGGGTGGHLFPGIALAQSYPCKPLFLCTNRPFDNQQLSRYGFDFRVLPSPRLSFKPAFIIDMVKSLYESFKHFEKFRPDFIVGVGGYGSFSPLLVALLKRIPFVLLEQNSLPGRITRVFNPFAKVIMCQWSSSAGYLYNRNNISVTGSPLRKEIKKIARSEARSKLGLTREKVIAVIGGSQGARPINEVFINKAGYLGKSFGKLAIIHLTGEKDYNEAKSAYDKNGIESFVSPFYEDMSIIYSAADMVLSRSGGIAIAEMAFFGLPMVLVPFPQAADNHQFFNARDVVANGAGIIVPQNKLGEKLDDVVRIIFDQERVAEMSRKARTLGVYCGSLTDILTFH
ncbi:MAG: UDP-N-acetylglucosamine--N-acetylmuramyl-(pentapeptide) pyrophosphoryl-undecaprenol N-acetylglucosamine transferase [Candidatus Brocadiia bacterium]